MLVLVIMTQKSHGFRRGTRKKFRARKKPTVTMFLQEFNIGDTVHVDIQPSIKAMPHHRFHGSTGKVIEKRGSAYVVEVTDRDKVKKIITKAVHLKKGVLHGSSE